MSDIKGSLVSILSADAGVLALMNSQARVYVGTAPQGADLPVLVLNQVSTVDRPLGHDGSAGIAKNRIQISCLGSDTLEVANVANAVRAALHGYTGAAAGITISRCSLDNQIDVNDIDLGAQTILDFLITHTE